MVRPRKQPLTPGDQAYGDKGRLDAALNDTPGARALPSGGQGGPVPVPTPPDPNMPPPAAIQAARNLPFNDAPVWGVPSARPNEPITAGIQAGAGPGPEALAPVRPDHVADAFDALGDATGDPLMYALGQRARLYRG